MVLELKLANKIADAEVHDPFPEEKPAQCMNAVYDLWNVLLLVQVDELETEQIGEFNLVEVLEENGNVVGVSVLKFGVMEDPKSLVGLQGLNNLGERNAIPQCLFQLDDGRYWLLSDVLDPLLGL